MRNNELFYSPGSLHEEPEEKRTAAEPLHLARAAVGKRPWLPLDNASKIFLSTMTSIDTKVYRLTAGLASDVRPELLQEALEAAYEDFPLYHAIIRRGAFWYFVERSDLKPEAEEENDIPCAQIYGSGRRNLLFRVLYKGNRIHLEVFHALSDGNGAIAFFRVLLIYYLNLCHSADGKPAPDIPPVFDAEESRADSFLDYFWKEGREAETLAETPLPEARSEAGRKKKRAAPVYRIRGENTADGRMNILEIHLKTSELLAAARASEGTLTSYLSAVFMLAAAKNMPRKKQNKARRVVLSVPVDLRQLYPSMTARNFFATVMLEYTFGRELWPSVSELSRILAVQLKEKCSKEHIGPKVRAFVRLEKLLPMRLIPLPLKDLFLRLGNAHNNLGITASMTNLGRFRLPESLTSDVQEINIMTSAVRPQFSMISLGQDLSLVFTSPKRFFEIEDTFCRILREEGHTISFAVEARAPEPRMERRRRERRLDETKDESRLRRRREAAGRILREDPGRRSAKLNPYPFVPLSLNLRLAKILSAVFSFIILALAFAGSRFWNWTMPLTIPMLAVFTLWATVSGILRNRHNPAWTILIQSLVLSLLVCGIDLFSGRRGWSISIALPIINGVAILASNIALLVSRKALERGVLFMQASAVLAFLPLIFILLGTVKPLWPNITVLLLAFLSLLLTGILRRKLLKEEFKRKWHL